MDGCSAASIGTEPVHAIAIANCRLRCIHPSPRFQRASRSTRVAPDDPAPQKPLDRRRKPDAPRQPASPAPREHLPAPAADSPATPAQAPTQGANRASSCSEQSLRSVTPVLARTLTIRCKKGFHFAPIIRHAPWSASPDPRRCAAARSGRPGARARARASVAAARSNRAVLATSPCRAACACAVRSKTSVLSSSIFRPDAVDTARPLPPDIADELALLQRRVPPFPSEKVEATIVRVFGRPLADVFGAFDLTPVASASVAQVHFAALPDGTPVAVKVLRPNVADVIEHDLALMHTAASLIERLWREGRPAADAGSRRRIRQDDPRRARPHARSGELLAIAPQFRVSGSSECPRSDWDWTASEVLVMERMAGIPIGRISDLVAAGVDLKLARTRCGNFLHAGVPRWLLSRRHAPRQHLRQCRRGQSRQVHRTRLRHHGHAVQQDTSYLAQNFLAFFRHYHRVATTHLESGWVPGHAETSSKAKSGSSANRSSTARSRTSRSARCSCNCSGRRVASTWRKSNPNRAAAENVAERRGARPPARSRSRSMGDGEPFLERWMADQIGFRALERRLFAEASSLVQVLPELPRLLHQRLSARRPRRSPRCIGAGACAAVAQPLARDHRGAVDRRHRVAVAAGRLREIAGGATRNPGCHATLRRLCGRRQREPHRRGSEILHAAGAVGLRQDDAAANGRRLRPPDAGRILLNGDGSGRTAAGAASGAHGVPELCAVSAHDGRRQRRVSAADGACPGERASGPHRRSTRETSASSGSARRYPHELSGGQKQRVGHSRARSSRIRRCCCSTSRWQHSTRSSARSCRSSSSTCRRKSASRSST